MEQCEEALKEAKTKPVVKFMVQSMNDLGCYVPDSFFRCISCKNESIIGSFSADGRLPETELTNENNKEPCMFICGDNVEKFKLSKSHVERTVVHELIHAYDQCRAKVDFNDCRHIACTEIRAAHLSSDCDFVTEWSRGQIRGHIKGQGSECAKRRAILSVQAHPHCKDNASAIVNEVFETCYSDTAPFAKKI